MPPANDEAEVLKRAFSFEELDAMDRRIKAARDGKVIEAPAVTEKKQDNKAPEAPHNTASDNAPGSSWRD